MSTSINLCITQLKLSAEWADNIKSVIVDVVRDDGTFLRPLSLLMSPDDARQLAGELLAAADASEACRSCEHPLNDHHEDGQLILACTRCGCPCFTPQVSTAGTGVREAV